MEVLVAIARDFSTVSELKNMFTQKFLFLNLINLIVGAG
jgi:hypothetical protein